MTTLGMLKMINNSTELQTTTTMIVTTTTATTAKPTTIPIATKASSLATAKVATVAVAVAAANTKSCLFLFPLSSRQMVECILKKTVNEVTDYHPGFIPDRSLQFF